MMTPPTEEEESNPPVWGYSMEQSLGGYCR